MLQFIFGTNSFLVNQKLRILEAEFLKSDPSGMNLDKIDGAELNFPRFSQAITAVPFLAPRRMVIVSNYLADNKDAELADKVIAMVNSRFHGENEEGKVSAILSDLVFVENGQPDKRTRIFKLLLKKAEVFEARQLEGRELAQFVSREFKSEQINISSPTIQHLVNSSGNDMQRLVHEVEKLSLYVRSQGRDTLLPADIDLLVVSDLDPNVFAFTEAVVKGDAKTASLLLGELLTKGENEQKLLGTISYQFRTLILIKDAEDRRIPERSLLLEAKLAPFVFNKNKSLIRGKTMRALVLMYDNLRKTDAIIKSSVMPADLALNILVATLCR